MKADAITENRPACFSVSLGPVPLEPTHKYQSCVEVVMILIVKVPVVLVCLSVEHFVEVPARIYLRRFFCGRKLFQYKTKGAQSVVEAGNAFTAAAFAE